MGFFDDDSLFIEELTKGHEWEMRLAKKFRKSGLEVSHESDLKIRESFADSPKYLNQKDMLVGIGDKKFHVECKSRNLKFTSIKDFPYTTVFVDTVYGWKNKKQKPVAVVMISTITEDCVVVPVSTFKHWGQQPTFDRVRKTNELNYIVDIKHLRPFQELIDWIKER